MIQVSDMCHCGTLVRCVCVCMCVCVCTADEDVTRILLSCLPTKVEDVVWFKNGHIWLRIRKQDNTKVAVPGVREGVICCPWSRSAILFDI